MKTDRETTKKLGYTLMVLATIFTLGISYVYADPLGADVGIISTSRATGGGTAGTVLAQAGNVTELEINGSVVSTAWQGFYGNISGNISMEDANGNKLYNWNMGDIQGEIYASQASTLTWGNMNCSNASWIAHEEWITGQSAADNDRVSETFSTGNPHPQFYVGTKTINTDYNCYTTYTYVNNASQAANYVFAEVILDDAVNRTAYVTLVNDSTTGFDGKEHDFQMIVPENGHNATAAAELTSYYFWVELN
jgi:hypothetical protein